MRRSFSTSALLACLWLPAAAAGAAESLEASLREELRIARGTEVYLLVDAERARLEVRSRGLVLDAAPIRRLALDVPGRRAGSGDDVRRRLPAAFVIQRGAPRRRELVLPETEPGEPSGQPPGEATERPDRPLLGLGEPSAGEIYTADLDGGWRVEIRGGGGAGFWRRFWNGLADPLTTTLSGDPDRPLIVIELARDDADRLRHLWSRGRELLVR